MKNLIKVIIVIIGVGLIVFGIWNFKFKEDEEIIIGDWENVGVNENENMESIVLKDFDLNFAQRKDLGKDKIIDKNKSKMYDFDVYTIGGDVTITVEQDMVYDFKEALEKDVISVNEIIAKANVDSQNNVCRMEYLDDGGTVIYMYDEYTLTKYNTLDGNRDFVVSAGRNNSGGNI